MSGSWFQYFLCVVPDNCSQDFHFTIYSKKLKPFQKRNGGIIVLSLMQAPRFTLMLCPTKLLYKTWD